MRWSAFSRCGKAVIFCSPTIDLPVLLRGEVPQADHRGELRDRPAPLPNASRKRSRLLCGLAKTMARLRLWKVSGRPACALAPSWVVGEVGLVGGIAQRSACRDPPCASAFCGARTHCAITSTVPPRMSALASPCQRPSQDAPPQRRLEVAARRLRRRLLERHRLVVDQARHPGRRPRRLQRSGSRPGPAGSRSPRPACPAAVASAPAGRDSSARRPSRRCAARRRCRPARPARPRCRARPDEETKRRRREWYAVISISIVRSTRMRPISRSIGVGREVGEHLLAR